MCVFFSAHALDTVDVKHDKNDRYANHQSTFIVENPSEPHFIVLSDMVSV